MPPPPDPTWIDRFIFGVRSIFVGGVALPDRTRLNFVSGATAVDNPATLSTDVTITPSGGGGGGSPSVADGRLSLSGLDPTPAADIVGASTLYYLPYVGGTIALYNGATWDFVDFSGAAPSLALSGLTANTTYDVFMFNNSGVATLELSAAWSGGSQTDLMGLQNGVIVKATDHTRRCVGTIRTTSTTTTEDSASKRFVWNQQNAVPRFLNVIDTTDSWAYGTGTWRQANANTANKVEFVWGGLATMIYVRAEAWGMVTTTGSEGQSAGVGIGINSTSVNSAQLRGSTTMIYGNPLTAFLKSNIIFPGHVTLNWLEYGVAGSVFYGDVGTGIVTQMGMQAEILA